MITRGWFTSEHLLALLVVVLGALPTLGLFPEGSPWLRMAGLVAAALASMGYSASRAAVKAAAADAAAWVPETKPGSLAASAAELAKKEAKP